MSVGGANLLAGDRGIGQIAGAAVGVGGLEQVNCRIGRIRAAHVSPAQTHGAAGRQIGIQAGNSAGPQPRKVFQVAHGGNRPVSRTVRVIAIGDVVALRGGNRVVVISAVVGVPGMCVVNGKVARFCLLGVGWVCGWEDRALQECTVNYFRPAGAFGCPFGLHP
jgi:hypothetical protein